MRRLLIFIPILLLLALRAFGAVPEDTLARLKRFYPEQSQDFILMRLKKAQSDVDKWRAFAPYYYDLVDRNFKNVPESFSARKGLCAGDAHLENFGFLYLNKPFFRLNDLDDVAPCALNADLLHFLIGLRLVNPMSAGEFIAEYKAGFDGKSRALPAVLRELEDESKGKKTAMKKTERKLLEQEGCVGEFEELSLKEMNLIKKYMQSEKLNLLKACSFTKQSGGSAGNKRFTIFHQLQDGVEAFELKPLVRPAPLYKSNMSVNERQNLFKQAVDVYLGSLYSEVYYPVVLDNKPYQRRPIWGGNQKPDEKDLNTKDWKEVALYEVRTLGAFHRLSNSNNFNMSEEEFERLAKLIENEWRKEFGLRIN